MKKIIALLAAFLLVFAFAGCGEYSPPEKNPGGNNPPVITDPENPVKPDDPEKELPFTVSLIDTDGNALSVGADVYALWNEIGGSGVYRASFDKEGVAKCEGLDGDYRVTLSSTPEGYTYNPNDDGHIATNFARDVNIILYPLTPYTGEGTDMTTDVITLSLNGAYRATLKSVNHTINFQFRPTVAGVYSITSMIDVTANVLNPLLDLYMRNSGGFNLPLGRYDSGGAANTYTKNFRWEMKIAQQYIGGVFAFAIHADALSDEAFPVNIDFILEKDGDFTEPKTEYTPVPVTENFISVPESTGLTFNYAASLRPNRLLDGSLFELGADGYYRFKDGGARIYVKVNAATQVMDAFTYELVNKRVKGKDYNAMIDAYAAHTNSDGVYPLTEEFKAFLMDYANAQRLFNDGDGFAEDSLYGPGYNSTLEDQWLFACGFYTSGGAYRIDGSGGTITDLNY